ncbi:Purine nucleoside phosphorylase [Mycobacteroides abscessus]|nr:Purine nucleoside phosphorylase [Mycobacteroides abscessus]
MSIPSWLGSVAVTDEAPARGRYPQPARRVDDAGDRLAPDDAAALAAAEIATRTGVPAHRVAVVLGSGWAPAAGELGTPATTIPMADLPAFSPPSAAGHGGSVLSVPIGDSDERMLILLGRIHAYEGHDLRHVVHPVRTACAAGARTIILTNAAGGLREDYAVGQPVLISDHLNLTARSPLVGAQFVDLVDAYSPRLRALAREIDDNLTEGVYAGLPGPHYETPAEIACCARWARIWWACRRCRKPSRRGRPGPRCWGFPW